MPDQRNRAVESNGLTWRRPGDPSDCHAEPFGFAQGDSIARECADVMLNTPVGALSAKGLRADVLESEA